MKKIKQATRRRARLYKEQRGVCLYCGDKMLPNGNEPKSATFDHVIPRSFLHKSIRRPVGQFNDKVLVCKECNLTRGNRTVQEYLRELHGGLHA